MRRKVVLLSDFKLKGQGCRATQKCFLPDFQPK